MKFIKLFLPFIDIYVILSDTLTGMSITFIKKKDGNESAFIRTGPETIVLQPSQFEEYRKRNFKRL